MKISLPHSQSLYETVTSTRWVKNIKTPIPFHIKWGKSFCSLTSIDKSRVFRILYVSKKFCNNRVVTDKNHQFYVFNNLWMILMFFIYFNRRKFRVQERRRRMTSFESMLWRYKKFFTNNNGNEKRVKKKTNYNKSLRFSHFRTS